jgi:hypothetical protein
MPPLVNINLLLPRYSDIKAGKKAIDNIKYTGNLPAFGKSQTFAFLFPLV